jgi:hypothetical protein
MNVSHIFTKHPVRYTYLTIRGGFSAKKIADFFSYMIILYNFAPDINIICR